MQEYIVHFIGQIFRNTLYFTEDRYTGIHCTFHRTDIQEYIVHYIGKIFRNTLYFTEDRYTGI